MDLWADRSVPGFLLFFRTFFFGCTASITHFRLGGRTDSYVVFGCFPVVLGGLYRHCTWHSFRHWGQDDSRRTYAKVRNPIDIGILLL